MPLATRASRVGARASAGLNSLAAASVLDFVAALHREQRPSAAAGRFAQLHTKIQPPATAAAQHTRASEMSDAPATWSERADDDQANAADALSAAAAQLDMVGRGPMSPVKDPRPRDAPKSGNRRPRKPGGAGFDGTVVTEDGASAEVPKQMEDDVGGKSPFDNVAVDGDESEEKKAPEVFKCQKNCEMEFKTKAARAKHHKSCIPLEELETVDDDAAAALTACDEGYRAAPHKRDFVVQELARYKPTSETKSWSGTRKLKELRELIANGAETLEKKEGQGIAKAVVAWLANGGDGAQKYLFEGGMAPASKDTTLNFAGETGYAAGGKNLIGLIADVADGKKSNEFVGARWATEGDRTNPAIIKVARKIGGRRRICLGQIAQERKDDRAKHATRVEATGVADAKQHRDWCRTANATSNVGASEWTRHVGKESGRPFWHNAATGQSHWTHPQTFVQAPRVALPAESEAQMRAVAGTYASRQRGRGLGDLISLDPEVRARAVAARTGGAGAYDASRAPAWEGSV